MSAKTKLADIQRALSRSIAGIAPSDAALFLVRESKGCSTSQRLGVYRSAYKIRMLESLRDDFARVEDELGEDQFRNLVHAFLEKHRSTYASLAELSQEFPDFVKANSPAQFRAAAIDWLETVASYARGIDPSAVLSADEIQTGASFRIVRNPTLQFLSNGQEQIVAYRSRNDATSQSLSSDEARILNLLESQMDLSTAVTKLEANLIDINAALPIISAWMRSEILYCERIQI